jgi:hypothetical protein
MITKTLMVDIMYISPQPVWPGGPQGLEPRQLVRLHGSPAGGATPSLTVRSGEGFDPLANTPSRRKRLPSSRL